MSDSLSSKFSFSMCISVVCSLPMMVPNVKFLFYMVRYLPFLVLVHLMTSLVVGEFLLVLPPQVLIFVLVYCVCPFLNVYNLYIFVAKLKLI